jgi:type VII secretion integral membrane protein EccD
MGEIMAVDKPAPDRTAPHKTALGEAALCRLTVQGPARRLDLCLPAAVPLAELLPEVLRSIGPGQGGASGDRGWVLRRTDGHCLPTDADLDQLGIRDGEVLYLVPVDQDWPELDYDDVVEVIADGSRRATRGWEGSAAGYAASAVAALALALGLAVLPGMPGRSAGLTAAGLAVLLLSAGAIVAQAYGEPSAAVVLSGFALPYATAGGLLLARPTTTGLALAAGSASLLAASIVGGIAVPVCRYLFLAGMVAATFGALGAALCSWLPVPAAAALVLCLATIGCSSAAPLAVRLGRLPVPELGPPPIPGRSDRPERATVYASAERAEEILAGLILGLAIVAITAAVVVAHAMSPTGLALVGLCGTTLLLRSRLFFAVRPRAFLLLGGAGTGSVLLMTAAWMSGPALRSALAAILVLAALITVVAPAWYRRRPTGGYLGRAADLLDTLCMISVVPLAILAAGVFAAAREWFG